MIDAQQFTPADSFATPEADELFRTAPPRRLPGPATGTALFDAGGSVRPTKPMPDRAITPSNPVRGSEVTPWYRAKRVWLAAALLFVAIGFRVTATPESATLQSAVVPADATLD